MKKFAPGIAAFAVVGLTAATPAFAQTPPNCDVTTENTALLAEYPAVRAFYDAINTNSPDLLDCAFAPTWLPAGAPAGTPPGPASMKARFGGFAQLFSTYEVTTQEVVVAGDTVVVRSLVRARQAGPFMGIAPTDVEATFMTIDIHHVGPDGLIVENFGAEDLLEYFMATGALP